MVTEGVTKVERGRKEEENLIHIKAFPENMLQ